MGDNLNTNEINGITPFKPGSFGLGKSAEKIAVIDNYSMPVWLFDNKSLTHGKIIERIIQEGLPIAQIDSYEASTKIGTLTDESFDVALTKLLNKINSGEKYDAVNMSLGCDFNYDEVSKAIDDKITPANIAKHKDKILEYIKKSYPKTYDSINKLSKIAEKTDVYISAGNDSEAFNSYSLANNVISVGGLGQDNKPDDKNCSNNALVKKYAKNFITTQKIKVGTEEGIDYTGDGTIDVPIKNVSGEVKNFLMFKPMICGTSISAPRVLVDEVIKKEHE